MDEMPVALQPALAGGIKTAPHTAVAQLAPDLIDEHFPMLILGTNTYDDFKFTTRFKIMDGIMEQMAGVAFRMQDEKNYYYVRASALGNTFYFYRVFKGERAQPTGRPMKISPRTWHELSVECKGPLIHIWLDGESIWEIKDLTFSSGKIALWTKSDSISYFTDTHVTYTAREPFVQRLVRETVQENPRLLDLQVLTVPAGGGESRVIASKNVGEIGQPGEKTDSDCIARGVNYYRKNKNAVYVTMPLRDRNGESVAAIRLVMKSESLIQTQENALIRAMPIVKAMQLRAATVEQLY
jgi:hypothetical protein